jgi:uncharacterized membrane protein
MNQVLDYLLVHSLASLLLALSIVMAALLLIGRRRHQRWSLPLLHWGAALVLLAAGALGAGLLTPPPQEWAAWIAAGAAACLFAMLAIVVLTGRWSAKLACGLSGLLLLGLGAMAAEPGSRALNAAVKLLASLRPTQPWWLLILLVIPIIIWLSFRSLASLGPVRRWVAVGLRCLLIALLALALAETEARRTNDSLTVLFLWDRSLSMPQELEGSRDHREERIKSFINTSVAERGPGHEHDLAGLIVFGRWPRLELPPSDAPQFRLRKVASTVDDTHTDISAALKLALASFPEGTGKRIVLISDGNENLGKAEEQARIAKQNGVQIDVVPVSAGRRSDNEVLVERVEAPSLTEKDARLPIRIVIRSHNPNVVVGMLKLVKISPGLKADMQPGDEKPLFDAQPVMETVVKLRKGLNAFFYTQPGLKQDESYTFEAKFVPLRVEDASGKMLQHGLPGDRVENNTASTNVMARGQKTVLLVEPNVGDHKLLADRLRKAKSSLKVVAVTPGQLPQDPAQLALILSRFDSVILANLPAETLTEEQQKVIRSNTYDQGSGLIMVGGPQSFGAGGWQDTEVEKALPVTADLKSMKIDAKSGLVLIMHASEMAEGNMWQKKIAKIAIEKLSSYDMVGMLYFDWSGQGGGRHTWHIPFQQIRDRRGAILRLVDSMQPGDMPDAEPALKMAHDALTDSRYGLGTKHIIFISDGDHWEPPRALLQRIRNRKITCTTVCITTHGAAEVAKMKSVADATRGRSYHVTDPKQLPAIYIKESRLVSQSFVYEKPFQPVLTQRGGPTEGLPAGLEPLHGFVRTQRRPGPLVEVPIVTPKLGDLSFPILAYWHYGLGKGVAFTSDARSLPGGPQFWDRDWASSNTYGKFWEQVVEWSLRPVETGKHLSMTTELRDGKVHVIVDARDDNKNALTDVEFRARLSSPALKESDGHKELRFEQKNVGVYEAEFKAEDVGSYFLNVQARWKDKGKEQVDNIRGGVTIPYSPEFAEMESNTALLQRLRDLTGGTTIPDNDEALARAARSGEVFRPLEAGNLSMLPLWPWLALLAGVCLFFDVAVRRIAVDPTEVSEKLRAGWARLRGRGAAAAAMPQFLDRLKTRKVQVGEAIDKGRATRRFEADALPSGGRQPPEVASAQAPQARPPAPTPVRPEPERQAQPEDYASRLMRAKKRAMEEREKES